MTPAPRTAERTRTTGETSVTCRLALDGTGSCDARTGLGLLDHMLAAFAHHSKIDLTLHAEGDLHTDDHHTAEDVAITLGTTLDGALGDRSGIARFGSAYAPLDESLARAVVDLSGRAHATVNLGLARERLGDVSCENLTHFFVTLAHNTRCALHLDVLRGENDHHRAEAAFKSCALALRHAVSPDNRARAVPSTKGVL